MKRLKILFLPLIIIFLTGCNWNFYLDEPLPAVTVNNDLKVHYLDVGEADSIFIELPNGETMLIDAGEAQNEEKIADYIENLNYDTINYVIGTHPHADHIGGLAYIIKNFEVKNIYMPKVAANTKTYENLLKTIKSKSLSITVAEKDKKIINTENLKAYFLAPENKKYDELNNYSAILKIVFQDKSFLFMGDSEASVEKTLTDVSADVIKVGHHGSNTSSSSGFIERVNPEIAVISVGENNKYDHPDKDVIKAYEKLGTKIYRTDLNGNIVISTDGENLDVEVEK